MRLWLLRWLARVAPRRYTGRLIPALRRRSVRAAARARRPEAVAAALETVAAARRPGVPAPTLVVALATASLGLREAGEADRAATALDEALHLGAQPASTEDGAALSALATALFAAGRPAEALDAAERAVARLRGHASADLAGALAQLGVCLSWHGRHEEAVAAHREAVDLYGRQPVRRWLVQAGWQLFAERRLALALAETGRHEEALAAVSHVIPLLAWEARFNKGNPMPGPLLRSVASWQAALGRTDDALTNGRRAVEALRGNVAVHGVAYEPELARALTDLGERLRHAGQPGEGEPLVREAVALWRRLPDSDAGLLGALGVLGDLHWSVDQDRGHATQREAVDVARRLAVDPSYETTLARHLVVLAARASRIGLRADALAAGEEAVALARRPPVEPATLALCLAELGALLLRVGPVEDAEPPLEEAVALLRSLAADDPDTHEPSLAKALGNFALARTGPAEVPTLDEAVALYERIGRDGRVAARTPLTVLFTRLARVHAAGGRPPEAVAAVARLAAVAPGAELTESRRAEIAQALRDVSEVAPGEPAPPALVALLEGASRREQPA
ncbi:tetratricopeptide repeat protein [Phytohabitans sp. LJ34]|uniref:tetratricopeptide repeat protein n=1 Tax=Phytohabitans sp. LJ34 TaxID=3452217 RepID=UPI003F8AE658